MLCNKAALQTKIGEPAQAVRFVLHFCGLQRLISEVEALRDKRLILSLYEPSSAQKGLLGAVTAFMDGENGDGAAIAQLSISHTEASLLRRAIVFSRFESFAQAAC